MCFSVRPILDTPFQRFDACFSSGNNILSITTITTMTINNIINMELINAQTLGACDVMAGTTSEFSTIMADPKGWHNNFIVCRCCSSPCTSIQRSMQFMADPKRWHSNFIVCRCWSFMDAAMCW